MYIYKKYSWDKQFLCKYNETSRRRKKLNQEKNKTKNKKIKYKKFNHCIFMF